VKKLKRLEAKKATKAVIQQYKLELSSYQEFLEDMAGGLAVKLYQLEHLPRQSQNPWSEHEMDRLRQEFITEAKQFQADSQKPLTELLSHSADQVTASC
jgi:hypothetical protein